MRFWRDQNSARKWARGDSRYIMVKNLALFSLYPENFSEAKFKGNISVVGEISREKHIQTLILLTLNTFGQFYSARTEMHEKCPV